MVIYDFRALRGLRGRFLKEILFENAAFCNKIHISCFRSSISKNYLFWRGYGADVIVCQRLTTFRVFPAMHPKSSILLRVRRLQGIAVCRPEAAHHPRAFCLSGTPLSGRAGRGWGCFKSKRYNQFVAFSSLTSPELRTQRIRLIEFDRLL